MSVTIDKMKAVFLAALDKTTVAERTAFLDETCAGEASLRHSVDALLRAHNQADPLLDHPAAEHLEWSSSEGAGPDGSLGFLDPALQAGFLGRLGHYEILEVLGRGGFGIVLRAFDDRLQRVVAVKVLAPQLAASSSARKRFVREARSSAMIRHENVVQVYAVEEHPLPFLVMEFIPGETLQQRLDRTGPLEAVEVLQIGRQIALGLAAAHSTGLIHRDIKPGNILIESGPQLRIKITDFGLARAADDASMTKTGLVAGTPMFMAPEQASGDVLDHRADLFSLGSVLYTLCSGRPPFRANSTLAVLKRVAEETPRPIPEIIPDVPLWLCDIITRLHAKKPEDRFASAQDMADLLTRRLAQMQHPGNVPALRPGFRCRRWVAAAAVLLLLLGGLGFTEATGVTNVRGTVIRLFSPEGTLVVEVDNPEVSVKIEGKEIVITGAGAKEIRLKPGKYTVEASRDGKVVHRELVHVTKNGRQVVRVSQEPADAKVNANLSAWERSLAALPASEQAAVVVARFKERNPDFKSIHAQVTHKIEGGVVTELYILGVKADKVTDISPVRALAGLQSFECTSGDQLSDLSPLKDLKLTFVRVFVTEKTDLSLLKDMKLTTLDLYLSPVTDLSPLKAIRTLTTLNLTQTRVTDLSPLKGMNLTSLHFARTIVTDLSPLKGMNLTSLSFAESQVEDLSPLQGMKLTTLACEGTRVTDLSPLAGLRLEKLSCDFKASRNAKVLRAITTLKTINGKPAAQFWKEQEPSPTK